MAAQSARHGDARKEANFAARAPTRPNVVKPLGPTSNGDDRPPLPTPAHSDRSGKGAESKRCM